jgi:hypothetical protein
MAKVFEQFHFSLIERDEPSFLDPTMDRETWLRQKFGAGFSFMHHRKEFFWVPQPLSKEFVVGVVERQRKQSERTPPEEGAEEIEGQFWTGSMVVIDPMNRPDGQRVAFEYRQDVGQPGAILASLISAINADSAHQYALHFKPLFRGDSFWRFAEKHGGRLKYVSFRFTVPNMIFGAGGGVKKGLKRIGSDTDAQEVELKVESDDGVRADSETVKEGLAYGEEGNARVTAKALSGEYWSSTRRKLTVKMHSILNLAEMTAGEVQRWLKQALDRDSDSSYRGTASPDGDVERD